MSDVAIIGGTGHQGYGLALRWAVAGKSVTIGSRDAERAEAAAERLRGRVSASGLSSPVIVGLANEAAAADAPVVVVAVPLAAQIATIKAIREHLQPNALLIDVTI